MKKVFEIHENFLGLTSYVIAENRGKAKYKVFQSANDAWGNFQFKNILSCKRRKDLDHLIEESNGSEWLSEYLVLSDGQND